MKKKYYRKYNTFVSILPFFQESREGGMGGWHRVGSDDAFPIRQALSVGAWFWYWVRWAQFSIENFVYVL